MGWTSPALPVLQTQDAVLPHVTTSQASWISCLLPLGAVMGAAPACCISDRIGRRKALLLTAIPLVAGWLFILLAHHHVQLVYLGRFITGLGLGATSTLTPRYTEEIAEDGNRGALGVYFDFMLSNGIFLINILGSCMTFMGFTTAAAFIPIIFVITFYWMPESPVYLICKDCVLEAEESLSWLRKGKKCYNVEEEIKYLKVMFASQSKKSETTKFTINFRSPTAKAVFVVYMLMIFQQTTGIDALLFYTVQIFKESGSPTSAHISSIVIAGVQSLTDLCSSFIVDKLGRRPMLLLSAAVTTASHAVLSLYFHFKDDAQDVSQWKWLPMTTLVIFMIGFASGFSPLPWLIMAELLPTDDKWTASGAACINWTMVFIITKTFRPMQMDLGNDVTYAVFCVLCTTAFVFVYFAVPETKGISKEEIIDKLRGRSKCQSNG